MLYVADFVTVAFNSPAMQSVVRKAEWSTSLSYVQKQISDMDRGEEHVGCTCSKCGELMKEIWPLGEAICKLVAWEGKQCAAHSDCGNGMWCGSACNVAIDKPCNAAYWKTEWKDDVCQKASEQACVVRISVDKQVGEAGGETQPSGS